MFFHNKNFHLSLVQYGIFVPMLDQRVQKIADYLKKEHSHRCIKKNYQFDINNIKLAHSIDYLNRLKSKPEKEITATYELVNPDGSYHRYDPDKASRDLKELLSPIFSQTQGSIEAVLHAFKEGFAFNLGGGLHHAMTDQGRGFCLVNDIIIAARFLQETHPEAKHIWVIDVDAHKGDGTAEITQNDSSVSTLSIHMAKGWPLDTGTKSDPWFIPSNVEIPIEESEQEGYLSKLEQGLNELKDRFPKPDMAIVVQGSDPYEKDGLPGSSLLSLSKSVMLKRDLLVYHFLKEQNVPQAYVLSGGYGEHAHEIYIQFLEAIKKDF